jgi:hypothetical protein
VLPSVIFVEQIPVHGQNSSFSRDCSSCESFFLGVKFCSVRPSASPVRCQDYSSRWINFSCKPLYARQVLGCRMICFAFIASCHQIRSWFLRFLVRICPPLEHLGLLSGLVDFSRSVTPLSDFHLCWPCAAFSMECSRFQSCDGAAACSRLLVGL